MRDISPTLSLPADYRLPDRALSAICDLLLSEDPYVSDPVPWADVQARVERDYTDPQEAVSLMAWLRRQVGIEDYVDPERLDVLLAEWDAQSEVAP